MVASFVNDLSRTTSFGVHYVLEERDDTLVSMEAGYLQCRWAENQYLGRI